MTSSTSPPSGGGFRLDVEKADAAVVALRRIHDELEALRGEATRLARTSRTATDAVSTEAFDLLSQKADGGPGSFGYAVEGAAGHVRQLIEQMNADIARQRELDEAAERGMDGRA